jgi:hypothetical protein
LCPIKLPNICSVPTIDVPQLGPSVARRSISRILRFFLRRLPFSKRSVFTVTTLKVRLFRESRRFVENLFVCFEEIERSTHPERVFRATRRLGTQSTDDIIINNCLCRIVAHSKRRRRSAKINIVCCFAVFFRIFWKKLRRRPPRSERR